MERIKSMAVRQRWPEKAVVLAVIVLLIFLLTPGAWATDEEPPQIVDETFIPIDDDTMDGLGYLVVQAMIPEGFSGAVYVGIREQITGARVAIELTPLDGYYTGVWLPVGSYQVVSGRIPEGDYFTVSWDVGTVTLSQDTDAALMVSVTSDGSLEAEISGKLETFTPGTAPEETEAPTEPGTAPEVTTENPPETTAAEPTTEARNPAVFSARRFVIDLLAVAAFVGTVVLCVYIFLRIRQKKN